MRTAITVGWKHGGKESTVIIQPTSPVSEHHAAFKKLDPNGVHDTFQRVEIWESDSGVVLSREFITQKERTRRDEAAKQLEAEREKFAKSSKARK